MSLSLIHTYFIYALEIYTFHKAKCEHDYLIRLVILCRVTLSASKPHFDPLPTYRFLANYSKFIISLHGSRYHNVYKGPSNSHSIRLALHPWHMLYTQPLPTKMANLWGPSGHIQKRFNNNKGGKISGSNWRNSVRYKIICPV